MSEYVMTYEAEFGLFGCGSDDEVHEVGEAVMRELLKLEGVDGLTDSSVSTDAARGTVLVELAMVVPDGYPHDPRIVIGSAVRTAFHAASIGTPGWQLTERPMSERTDTEYTPA